MAEGTRLLNAVRDGHVDKDTTVASSLLVPQEGVVLGLFDLPSMGILGYTTAAVIGAWLRVSIIRSGKL